MSEGWTVIRLGFRARTSSPLLPSPSAPPPPPRPPAREDFVPWDQRVLISKTNAENNTTSSVARSVSLELSGSSMTGVLQRSLKERSLSSVIRLSPSLPAMADAVAEIFLHLQWKTAAVIGTGEFQTRHFCRHYRRLMNTDYWLIEWLTLGVDDDDDDELFSGSSSDHDNCA